MCNRQGVRPEETDDEASSPHPGQWTRPWLAAMRLTPREQDLLLVFVAAEVARRRRASGLKLNHPEAVAIICDAMLEAARAGSSYAEVEEAGRAAVREDEVLEGVSALLDEVRLEVLLDDGTRLIVLIDPVSDSSSPTTSRRTKEHAVETG